ncbi:hypothetical protein [Sphingomonas sp.]|uniref:hypothetical protein n=1 Tax=Sphingomonas sp. TaxID=28214 RepID=UPI001B130C07|nr:hypothetical protein [Sphingomonas sp.]MBO9713061.1 hypothetical protein [Sphingomonas sp.]
MTLQQIRDWYRARPGYWFRPKLFGWGAVPVTWQGWASVAAMVALAWPIGRLAEARGPQWLALLVPLLLAFAWLCWAKTDGEWRWRWGA